MMAPSKERIRLEYLDWLRGLAAIIMLQGHVFHSLLRPELRDGSAYVLSQFVGGMPPAIFLFLTGVTLGFLMDSRERRGDAGGARVLASLRRAGYLLAIAFVFRIQLWLFSGPDSPWTDILKVDILNCMGLALALMSPLAAFRTGERIRLGAVLGVAIAAASPLISEMDWSRAPVLLKSYLAPGYDSFSIFPWAAFVPFGVSAGSIIRLLKAEHKDRTMQWAALVGGALILAGQYFSNLPYSLYPKSEFWLNSPALIFIKLGIVLVLLAFAYLWTRHGAGEGWSWVRQFGMTSLLVYWVHIELVYGRWLWFWKESLDVGQTTAAAAGIILLMLLLSSARTHGRKWLDAINFDWLRLTPRRVAGD